MGALQVVKIIMFIVVIAGAIGLSALLFLDTRKTKGKDNGTTNKVKNLKTTKESNKKETSSNKKDKINIGSTQDTLPFKSIELYSPDNPTGLILKNDDNTFVGVIEVYGINYNLLDVSERELLEKGFEILLNGIDYPIQLFNLSRKIDIENYRKTYNDRLNDIKKSLEKTIDRINFYKDSATNSKEIEELEERRKKLESQYTYGVNLENYIVARCKQSNMLERRYYIVLTHTYNSTKFKEELTKEEIKANAFFDIQNRASSLIGALQRTKLSGKLLTGTELAELLYISYNKADSERYRIEDAFNSRFSHLFTTAEAVEIKSMKRRLKELELEEQKIKKEIDRINNKSKLEEDEELEKVGA